MNKSARDLEDEDLVLCSAVARGQVTVLRDPRGANVANLAGSVLRSRLPDESKRLKAAAEAYFSGRPEARVSFDEAERRGWVSGLPRLRDMLTARLSLGAPAMTSPSTSVKKS